MKYPEFPKISRLNRDIVITEKIDGTNAQVFVQTRSDFLAAVEPDNVDATVIPSDYVTAWVGDTLIAAGSRTRWIAPTDDNSGFAKWVLANAEELVTKLGFGQHFGEWWGSGIQRGYGLVKGEKRFSLFNVARWNNDNKPSCVSVVPTLYSGPFSQQAVLDACQKLRESGSAAAPGFMKPEGVVVYHTAARQLFKVTLEKDEKPKGSTE